MINLNPDNMKSLFLLFLIPFISYSQESLKRDLTVSVLDAYFKDAVGTTHKLKSTLEDSLNWEIEFPVDMPFKEFELKNDLKETSKDLIYTSINSAHRIKIYQTLTEECGYKYILFKVTYISEDYKKTSFLYSINMKNLLQISNNLSDDNVKNNLQEFKQ